MINDESFNSHAEIELLIYSRTLPRKKKKKFKKEIDGRSFSFAFVEDIQKYI
jgi:hypothetical protein